MRLDAFDLLPKHARRCVYWEVDPGASGDQAQLSDPEFEKEAWLSMVMLEWGSCGQIAMAGAAGNVEELVRGNGQCLGYVLYAPPRAVPRARCFPTGPVSADAVLLMSLGVEPGASDELPRELVTEVIRDLVRRGVRALEAFGRTAAVAELVDIQAMDEPVRSVLTVPEDCSVAQCVIDAEFLQAVGFVVVADHPYFPRLRLELDKGLEWKAEVEAALERLLASGQDEQPVGAGAGRLAGENCET